MSRFHFRIFERDGKVFLEIAKDLFAIHQAYAETLLNRYKENPRANFVTGSDEKEMRQWIIGQRLFQSYLNERRIPYIHDEPAFKFEEEKLVYADFIIPNFGTIEIKTRPYGTDTMLVKKAVWDKYVEANTIPDYVVSLMLLPDENVAQVMGYAYGKEIATFPNDPAICKYKPAYCRRYTLLHDAKELIERLNQHSLLNKSKQTTF